MEYSEEEYLDSINSREDLYIIDTSTLDDIIISIDVDKDRTQLNGGHKKEHYSGQSDK